MDKIKCVVSDNGTIIPIHNISLIAGEKSSHYVWTNADGYDSSYGHKLSDEQYNALLREVEFIGGKLIILVDGKKQEKN